MMDPSTGTDLSGRVQIGAESAQDADAPTIWHEAEDGAAGEPPEEFAGVFGAAVWGSAAEIKAEKQRD